MFGGVAIGTILSHSPAQFEFVEGKKKVRSTRSAMTPGAFSEVERKREMTDVANPAE
jgi:hypothetical protein